MSRNSIPHKTQFKCETVLFNPETGPCQVLPLRAREDLGRVAMKGYSAFPKEPAFLEPDDRSAGLVSYPGHILVGITQKPGCSRCILQTQPIWLGTNRPINPMDLFESETVYVISILFAFWTPSTHWWVKQIANLVEWFKHFVTL